MKGRTIFVVLLLLAALLACLVLWFATRETAPGAGDATRDTPAVVPAAEQAAAQPKRERTGRHAAKGFGSVVGRVREYGSERPLAGVEVSLDDGAPGKGRTVVTATTKDDGSFAFDEVAASDGWALVAKAAAPLADAAIGGIVVAAGRPTDVGVVYLSPAFSVPGIVVDSGGAPVEGAAVAAARRTPGGARFDILKTLRELPQQPGAVDTAVSAKDGTFRFTRLAPGTYDVRAQKTDFATAVESSVVVTPETAALRIVLAAGFSADGHVVRRGDDKNGALSGIPIVAFPEPRGSTRILDPLEKRFATTDEKGAFRLEGLSAARYIVAAMPEGEPYSINDRVQIPTTSTIELALGGDATLSGRVTGEGEKPVEAAQVVAMSEKGRAFATVLTDADGRYSVRGLASGPLTAFVVTAEHYGPYPDDLSKLRGSGASEVVLKPGANEKNVKLEAGGTVRGVVRETNGGPPIAGARVESVDSTMMFGSQRATTTGADGTFELTGMAKGTAFLLASKEGWTQALPDEKDLPQFMGRGDPPPADPGKGAMVVIAEGAAVVERTIELTRAAMIQGQVRSPDGAPFAGAQVTVSDTANSPFAMVLPEPEPRVTDASGNFEVAAPSPGAKVRLVARAPGLLPGSADAVAPAAGATASGVSIQLRRGVVVAGRVSDGDGRPVEGAIVRCSARVEKGQAPDRMRGSFDPAAEHSGVSDAAGAFRIEGVEPEPLSIVVAHPRYLPYSSSAYSAATGAPPSVDVTLTLGAVIAGVVVDPEGRGVSGASVELRFRPGGEMRNSGENRPPVVTGADGTFKAEGMTPGRWTIQARADGFVASERADVDTGGAPVTLRLAQAFTIAGVVRLHGGAGIAGINVSVLGAAPPEPASSGAGSKRPMSSRPTIASAMTRADGTFEIKTIPAGTYDVRAQPTSNSPGGRKANVLDATVKDVVAGRTDLAIDMDPGLVIAGTVFLADGSPASSGTLTCQLQNAPRGGDNSTHGVATIVAGRFELNALGPGVYDVVVKAPDHAPKKLTAQAGGAEIRVDLSTGGSIRGRVMRDGSPAKGAQVNANGPSGNGSSRTRDDGTYEIRGLAEGTYSVSAFSFTSNEPMQGSVASIAVRDGTPTDAPDITCEKVDGSRVPVPSSPPKPR